MATQAIPGASPLDDEQRELLSRMVEAFRGAEQRAGFYVGSDHINGHFLIHSSIKAGNSWFVYEGDLLSLAAEGFVRRSADDAFHITARGFKHYEELKRAAGEPVQRIEADVRDYVSGDRLQKSYSAAYSKWERAQDLLWQPDAEKHLTDIGHRCREAMQEFADILVKEHKPPNVDSDKSHTVARLRAVIQMHVRDLGEARSEFLSALVPYWGTVSDLVQRQVHGAEKEGEALVWEDARCVVFQTVIVMFEVDRALTGRGSRGVLL